MTNILSRTRNAGDVCPPNDFSTASGRARQISRTRSAAPASLTSGMLARGGDPRNPPVLARGATPRNPPVLARGATPRNPPVLARGATPRNPPVLARGATPRNPLCWPGARPPEIPAALRARAAVLHRDTGPPASAFFLLRGAISVA